GRRAPPPRRAGRAGASAPEGGGEEGWGAGVARPSDGAQSAGPRRRTRAAAMRRRGGVVVLEIISIDTPRPLRRAQATSAERIVPASRSGVDTPGGLPGARSSTRSRRGGLERGRKRG